MLGPGLSPGGPSVRKTGLGVPSSGLQGMGRGNTFHTRGGPRTPPILRVNFLSHPQIQQSVLETSQCEEPPAPALILLSWRRGGFPGDMSESNAFTVSSRKPAKQRHAPPARVSRDMRPFPVPIRPESWCFCRTAAPQTGGPGGRVCSSGLVQEMTRVPMLGDRR